MTSTSGRCAGEGTMNTATLMIFGIAIGIVAVIAWKTFQSKD
ncbi:hypothetical protein [Actinomadura citrea]|nr:hypothetical protein [Actinomadura citrea]